MDARKLVGMTQGARKRAAWQEAASAPHRFTYGMGIKVYRFGHRLRPCPGCYACGVRRFTQPQGFFTDNTHYIEIRDYTRVRLWRLKHTPILWSKRCGPRSVSTTHYTMEYCEGMVERGEWIELTAESICDGREVVLAKKEKARK